jgi:curved DNA-binding protein CbpA
MGSDLGDIDMKVTPKVVTGVDLNTVGLSAEEGYLFSRVDGALSLDQIVKSSGMETKSAVSVLRSLKQKGIISWPEKNVEATANKTINKDKSNQPWDDMVFDPFDLAEEVDLDENSKRKILYYFKEMKNLTYYQLLSVPRNSVIKEIKRAYFKISREFHPDSYFRKNLGGYKHKIETIFKHISKAYEVLEDSAQRSEYDASLPAEEPKNVGSKSVKIPVLEKEKLDKRRRERMKRMLKGSPILKSKKKAQQHFQDALNYQSSGETARAANCIKLALALDPNNQEFKKLAEQVEPKAAEIRAEKDFKQGQIEESMGRQEDALAYYLRAIDANSNDAASLHKAANILLEMKRDLHKAVSYCRQALALEPDNVKCLLTLSDIYQALGMHKNAVRELMKYVDNNPFDEIAVDKLKELKKMVR